MRHLLLVAAVLAFAGWAAARAEQPEPPAEAVEETVEEAADEAPTADETAAEAADAPADAATAEQRTRAEAIEEILSQPLDEGEYGEAVRCLSSHSYRNVRVLDDRHVLFEGSGGRAWLNRLRNRCIGLRPNATLRFRMRESRVCELDSFESVDTMFRGMDRVSATCSLGQFMPVTPEQVEAIRAAVEERRR